LALILDVTGDDIFFLSLSVAGPSSDTIYQGLAAGQTTASATFHFQTEKGQAAIITKPFVFTIS